MLGTKILLERTSKYNKDIKVVRTWGMGTYIQVNGLTQSGGIVESIWKFTLSKIRNPKPDSKAGYLILDILILGLGGGTLAKLLRKKYPNAKITGVEIDTVMVELGKRYLDLDKYDIEIVIGDANDYLLKAKDYDLVIVDTYLGDEYVEIARLHLTMAKMVIFNRLFYGDKKDEALKFEKKLRKVFKKVEVIKPVANIMFVCSNFE